MIGIRRGCVHIDLFQECFVLVHMFQGHFEKLRKCHLGYHISITDEFTKATRLLATTFDNQVLMRKVLQVRLPDLGDITFGEENTKWLTGPIGVCCFKLLQPLQREDKQLPKVTKELLTLLDEDLLTHLLIVGKGEHIVLDHHLSTLDELLFAGDQLTQLLLLGVDRAFGGLVRRFLERLFLARAALARRRSRTALSSTRTTTAATTLG
mmetsp:Transcript_25231/g.63344  ORF Transcript_25231/g.63344 Transcript_25231/m.63344 type:complete len:209 (-) Transcript_25231:969-1595(-)